jgi:hypothetical protein
VKLTAIGVPAEAEGELLVIWQFLERSLSLVALEDRKRVLDKMTYSGPNFSTRLDSAESETSSLSSFGADRRSLADLPPRPSFQNSTPLTQLGTSKYPLRVRNAIFKPIQREIESPPKWFSLLFGVQRQLLILAWAAEHLDWGKNMHRPDEVLVVQKILRIVLNVAGKHFGFVVEDANDIDLCVSGCRGSIIPEVNFVGQTDLLAR